jgi:hypothetical protein
MRRILFLVALGVILCTSLAEAKKEVDPKLYGSP